VYDAACLQKEIQQVTGAKKPYRWLYLYPPTFILILLPLALLPYLLALAVWLFLTLVGYLAIVRRIAPHPLTLWLTLAFPGTFLNVLNGQNAFLSSIFLGGGLILLESHPWLAGLLLGLLSYKPHLAFLIPLALLAGKLWQALWGALLSATMVILASLVVLGKNVWPAFLKSVLASIEALSAGTIPWEKMSSLYAGIGLFGGSYACSHLIFFTMIWPCWPCRWLGWDGRRISKNLSLMKSSSSP
jgi:hypothetical protein